MTFLENFLKVSWFFFFADVDEGLFSAYSGYFGYSGENLVIVSDAAFYEFHRLSQ